MKNNLIIVFSRAPILGKVKSRLAADIGDKAALEIHHKLFFQTLKTIEQTATEFKLYLSQAPDEDFKFPYDLQTGNNLGQRMAGALKTELRKFDNVCLIGSDCLDLKPIDIVNAFKLLEHNDVVLGPALDGGYYLIAMQKNNPDLFTNIRWGSSSVFEDTLRIAEKLKLKIGHLKTRKDVDSIDDLPDNWLPK